MATSSKNKDDSKKSMDISRPGKSSPDTSSRPVIVSHKPMMQDPMVKGEAEPSDADQTDAGTKLSPPRTKVITPPSEEDIAEATTKPEPDDAETADTQPQKEESVAEEAAVVDAVIDQAGDKGKKQDVESEADRKKREEVQKLIESKKYFVPIGQVTKRKNDRRILWGLLGLVLILVGFYALVDGGTIKPGFDVPFDFIKNEKPDTDTAQTSVIDLPAPTETTPIPKTTAATEPEVPKFSYKAPEGWSEKTEITENGTTITLASADFQEKDAELCSTKLAGGQFTIVSSLGSEKAVSEVLTDKSQFKKNQKEIVVDGEKGVEYDGTPGECGYWHVAMTYKDGYTVSILSYLGETDFADYNDEFQALVKSIKFE